MPALLFVLIVRFHCLVPVSSEADGKKKKKKKKKDKKKDKASLPLSCPALFVCFAVCARHYDCVCPVTFFFLLFFSPLTYHAMICPATATQKKAKKSKAKNKDKDKDKGKKKVTMAGFVFGEGGGVALVGRFETGRRG